MKKDLYLATLNKIQKSLESTDQKQAAQEIRNDIEALKEYIPQRIELLEKIIKSLESDREEINQNTLEILKQTPKDIARWSNNTMKNTKLVATPEMCSIIKEFNTISQDFAASYQEILDKNGIK